jgi:hypothetical protein
MTPEEYKLVRAALEDVKFVLGRKSIKGHARFELQCAHEKLNDALNWGDDERSSGCTDD